MSERHHTNPSMQRAYNAGYNAGERGLEKRGFDLDEEHRKEYNRGYANGQLANQSGYES